MYTQVYTHPNITYIVRVLGRYLRNQGYVSLERSQNGYEIFEENKRLHAHI